MEARIQEPRTAVVTLEQQVQRVRRRMVEQQVRLLRMSGVWSVFTEDHAADCVLAAGGDAVVAHRLLQRWFSQHPGRPAKPDLTCEDEQAIVQFIKQQAAGFDCDCGTCGRTPHGARIQHGVKP